MIITESNVSMSSTRQYTQSGRMGAGISGANMFTGTASSLSSMTRDSYESLDEDFLGTYERLLGSPISTGNVSNVGTSDDSVTGPMAVRNTILKNLMEKFMGAGVFGQNFGGLNMSAAGGLSGRIPTYYEQESTSFSATGQAKTADGRTIDFNIEMVMSRSYMEYTDIQINPLNNILMDPLTINIGNNTTDISDQKFMFDLNADGEEESISRLGRGSGFLALDKNGDGIINDGRELFGATTGDGFGELRTYDSDGNGWIDEADEVFNRLKVWCKDDDGNDILMDLKEAGVGAIFLGEQATEFSQYGIGGLNGVVRSTGFFLKESGEVGTVQHVDLAVNSKGYTEPNVSDNMGVQAAGSGAFSYETGNILTVEIPFGTIDTSASSKEESAKDRFKEMDSKDVAKNSASKNAAIKKEAAERRNRRMMEKKHQSEVLEKKRIKRQDMMDERVKKALERRKEKTEEFEEIIEGNE